MLFRREVGHVKTYLRNQILYNLGAKTGNLPEKFKDILVLGQQSLYTFGQIINQKSESGLYPFGSSEEDKCDALQQNRYTPQAILQDWLTVYRDKLNLYHQE